MLRMGKKPVLLALFGLAMLLVVRSALGADIHMPGIDIRMGHSSHGQIADAFKIIIVLTVLSLAPAILLVMTSFTRIIIVLSMLRQALGMQQTPPNTVLISLALFLTLFTMLPAFNQMNKKALQPFLKNEISASVAAQRGMQPLRQFMIRQTREQDLALMIDTSGAKRPESVKDISNVDLIPAFMLSELKTAFQIGFVIFLPFLLVDLLVASILMSMGMLMVPPMMISLPIKVMMFVLIDGWHLVVKALLGSFH